MYRLRGGPAASRGVSLCACAAGPAVPAHVSATRGLVLRRACEVLLPGQRRRRASPRRTSRFASFACELLRERCWAAAAASAGVSEKRALVFSGRFAFGLQKRLHAAYEAGACRVPAKLAPAARRNVYRSPRLSFVLTFLLDAARYRQLPVAPEPPPAMATFGGARSLQTSTVSVGGGFSGLVKQCLGRISHGARSSRRSPACAIKVLPYERVAAAGT